MSDETEIETFLLMIVLFCIETQIQGIAMPCVQGTWQCCKGNGQRGDNPVFTDASSCKCDENADPVIQGQSGFALTAILPQSANGQIALIDSGGQTTGFIPVPSALPPSLPTPSSLSSSSATDLSAASSTSSYYATTITITPIPFSTSVSSISSSTNTASQVAATTSLSTSSASTTDATTTSSNNGANLRLILGISMPIILVLLAGLAFLAFRAYRHRRQSKRNSFNEGGWDPFRHQPVDRRESRSSAVWDSNYTAAGMADCMRHDDDDDDDDDDNDVAAAVRMNAEAQRKHRRSENGRLRPMSELGGFVSWKGTA